MKKNENMFLLFVLMIFSFNLLLVQSSIVCASNINEIMTLGETSILDEGTIYFNHEQSVFERDNFVASLLFLQSSKEVVSGEVVLEKHILIDGDLITEELLPSFKSGDLENNETYFLAEWNDTILNNTTYTVKFMVGGLVVYEKDYLVEAKPKKILEHKIIQQTFHENVSLKFGDENNNSILRSLLSEKGFDFSAKEFIDANKEAENYILVDKTIEKDYTGFTDGTNYTESTIYIKIKPLKLAKKLLVIEEIPKAYAKTTKNVIFSQKPVILKDDPLIMWNLEDVNKSTEVSYKLEGDISITGETVILGNFAVNNERSFNKGIIFAIIIIPLIAGVLIYFSRFAKK